MPTFPCHPPPYHHIPLFPLPSRSCSPLGDIDRVPSRPNRSVYYVPIIDEDDLILQADSDGEEEGEERDEKTRMMEAEMPAEMLEHAVSKRSGKVDKMQLDDGGEDDSFWDQFEYHSYDEDEDEDDSTSSGFGSEEGSDDAALSDGTITDGGRPRSPSPPPSLDCPKIRIRPATPSPDDLDPCDPTVFFPLRRTRNPPAVDHSLLSPTWCRTFPEAFIPRPRSTRRKAPSPPTMTRSQSEPVMHPWTDLKPLTPPAFEDAHPKLPPIKLRIPPNQRRSSTPPTAFCQAHNLLPPPLEKTWSSAILPGMECWSPTYGGGGGVPSDNGGWPECWGGEEKRIKVPELKGGWEDKENRRGRERLPSMKLQE